MFIVFQGENPIKTLDLKLLKRYLLTYLNLNSIQTMIQVALVTLSHSQHFCGNFQNYLSTRRESKNKILNFPYQ